MDENTLAIIDESIELELRIADLYALLKHQFPEDENFWWQLLLEEKNHAALIMSIKNTSEQIGGYPESMFATSLKELTATIGETNSVIQRFRESPPSREEALNTALDLEDLAGELHFQQFMENDVDTSVSEIFKQLNADDKDHARRIRSYMESNDIEIRVAVE